MHPKTIAIDFDGVIHSYTSKWTSAEEIHDPPVEGAIEFIRAASRQFNVVIFSARANSPYGARAIMDWLEKHGLAKDVQPQVTHIKPQAIIYLDDRGWRFEGKFPSLEEIAAFKPWNR